MKQTAIKQISGEQDLLNELYNAAGKNLLEKWYPLSADKENGGYYTNVSYDWEIDHAGPKMIVTQARHIWTASKAACFFNNDSYFTSAEHGLDFLMNKMWDEKFGGFYQMRSYKGGFSDHLGFKEEKRTYGNAFAVYGLAALYAMDQNKRALNFAKIEFNWIENHAYDNEHKGYIQFLTREGMPFGKDSDYKTTADDAAEVGYKDQNSSIHLLEAYTELYNVWKDPLLKKRLAELLVLIRDFITTPKGYMNLFFQNDWKPLSFADSPDEIRKKNYRLDHVSFGHNYETAFLLLEASHALGIKNDTITLSTAKRMLDHAISNGWDNETGGFFDEGYYFKGDDKCTIIKSTKNWWAQAEGLNILLMMSKIFPDSEIYRDYFFKQWNYIKTHLLDSENGGWFEGGLDKEPHFRTGPKGHIWKCAYHTGRALMNCIAMLADDDFELCKSSEGFIKVKQKSDEFINHWKKTAGNLR